ncbi:unnamed protein product [Spirodela intermedia]|uniref:XRCC4 N-terminal domain-containing protein n=1 Tax=Spirodela intermedia TaxID=51605 RepID=A0A7I8L203_SPIIN|nr:unnamed protein product [Spirodela intermedia]
MDSPPARHTCLRLRIADADAAAGVVFIKGTWFALRFDLSITDGYDAWTCNGLSLSLSRSASPTHPCSLAPPGNLYFRARFPEHCYLGCCAATEAEVRQRAAQWDQPVAEYMAVTERHLGFQQPGSLYKFEDAGNGQRRVRTCGRRKSRNKIGIPSLGEEEEEGGIKMQMFTWKKKILKKRKPIKSGK